MTIENPLDPCNLINLQSFVKYITFYDGHNFDDEAIQGPRQRCIEHDKRSRKTFNQICLFSPLLYTKIHMSMWDECGRYYPLNISKCHRNPSSRKSDRLVNHSIRINELQTVDFNMVETNRNNYDKCPKTGNLINVSFA